MENQNNELAVPQSASNQPANAPAVLSPSERFLKAVQREIGANVGGEVKLTSFQQKLIQNYFIKLDMILKASEQKRMTKPEQYREPLPYTWENVNLQQLAVDVISFSSVGLDPTQPNHINPIPYKNNKTNKYDVTFIPGYKGIELKARKYGYDIPDEVTVEVVYKNDIFKQFKKDSSNRVEGYKFEVVDDFNRGEVVGGFYYHSFNDNPTKNKLRVFTLKDIEKRKPDHASAEFWGGEKDKWVNGKKEGKEPVEGWFDEMVYKTIYRAAYNAITIDSAKIDENYLKVITREQENRDAAVAFEIQAKSNKVEVGFDADPETGEVIEAQPKQLPAAEPALTQVFTVPVQQAQPSHQQPQAPQQVNGQKSNAPF